MVATGATPRILSGAQPDGERILTWQQVYNLTELPEHLIVVGSGVTGAEFVSAFAELGVKVTMVASRDRILPHDDADAADVLETVLSERGVELERNCRVETKEIKKLYKQTKGYFKSVYAKCTNDTSLPIAMQKLSKISNIKLIFKLNILKINEFLVH